MTLDESIVERRLHVITRASELGNVSQACREAGISRTLFYRWRKRFERYGADGLNPSLTRAKVGRPIETPPHVERLVIAWALSWPTWRCGRIAAQLGFLELAEISASTVQRILRRSGLPTRRERLAVLEAHTAQRAGLLTERSRRALQRARANKRHVEASTPGELVCLDTFYIGRLKGVGKVWQITACDAASSFGTAAILPALDARSTARFLEEVLVPLYREAGHPVQRVLVDGGSEFKSHFRMTCKRLGIRRTTTKPRHAWTNGFVERLQGTILHEHWRIAFRRRYFTRRSQLARSLEAFVEFYNHQRPHQGYQTQGRTPAQVFYGPNSTAA